jgi:hypothetical protein
MPTRREFIESATVMLLMVPVARCTSSNPTPAPTNTPANNAAAPTPDAGAPPAANNGCNGIDETSTVVASHSHMVCVLTSDLSNPPSGGVTYTTTNVAAHTHMISLTQAQLLAIQAGQTVMVTTSVAASHTHDFTIQKMT